MFAAAARVVGTAADISGMGASLSLTESGWDRRDQDWHEQVIELDIQIEQIERQILAAERRRDIMLRQLNNHLQQMEQAGEIQDFLRDKFTCDALYLYLQCETAALHRKMYDLALCAARQAERAFNVERGHTSRNFLPDKGWDNPRDGLLAGELLQLSLRQMERAYLDENLREYELTKHFSLRLQFPLAFLELTSAGHCEIELYEWMFDLDYPGHFVRRIKNVSVTVPCVTGPYTGLHCRLTLLSSSTRTDPTLVDVRKCCHDNGRCCPECEPSEGYRIVPGDPRIVHYYGATEAVGTSSGQNDPGMFELNFRDERYLPFEYSGAVSRWRIELPPENNQFDLRSISDLVLHVNYSAREGGEALRRAASHSTRCCLPGSGKRFLDVEYDLSDAWQRFRAPVSCEQSGRDLSISITRRMFALFAPDLRIRIEGLWLVFETKDGIAGGSASIEIVNPQESHSHEPHCACPPQTVACVATAAQPHLYVGDISVSAELSERTTGTHLGTFRFPLDLDPIRRVCIIVAYRAAR